MKLDRNRPFDTIEDPSPGPPHKYIQDGIRFDVNGDPIPADALESQTLLSEIGLNNFKCFECQTLPLGVLTLLTGHNAAGKSSSIQGLLLLSELSSRGNDAASISLNNERINIGSFGELTNDKLGEKVITLSVSLAKIPDNTFKEQILINLEFVFEHKVKNVESVIQLSQVKLCHENETDIVELSDADSLTNIDFSSHDSFRIYFRELLYKLKNIIYLSAERETLQDVFPKVTKAHAIHADVGSKGVFASWWFDISADEEIDERKLCPSEKANTLRKQVNAWLGTIFPGAQVNTVQIKNTNLVKLELRISDHQEWKRPGNIGYGISYTFPIIVAALLAENGQVLIVDSPEAHLHPMGQSKMGQFLSAMANAGLQVIIETHSDHLLNGIRVAVKEDIISCNEVQIYFFENNIDHTETLESTVKQININSKAKLSDWPDGFFDQNEKDLSRLIR